MEKTASRDNVAPRAIPHSLALRALVRGAEVASITRLPCGEHSVAMLRSPEMGDCVGVIPTPQQDGRCTPTVIYLSVEDFAFPETPEMVVSDPCDGARYAIRAAIDRGGTLWRVYPSSLRRLR